ncbi:hypothetical protein KL932_003008 [Ogataea haglerorum]|nr:hypothetical protein KL932_003008 [Ogataea haglerorum]
MDLARIFQGNFSVFQLEPGTFNLSDGTLVDNTYPSLYFTNASDWTALNEYLSSYQATMISTVLPLTRDDFHDSVIAISFVLCTVTVGFWLLFLIQSIATEKRPLHLQLITTLLAVFSTVVFVRFTTLMQEEFDGCFQDRRLVIDRLFNKLYYTNRQERQQDVQVSGGRQRCERAVHGAGGGIHLAALFFNDKKQLLRALLGECDGARVHVARVCVHLGAGDVVLAAPRGQTVQVPKSGASGDHLFLLLLQYRDAGDGVGAGGTRPKVDGPGEPIFRDFVHPSARGFRKRAGEVQPQDGVA